jgi:hypothetical protein
MRRVRVSLVLSFVALVGLTAGPALAREPDELLEAAKQLKQIEAQRVEREVNSLNNEATLVGQKDPARAIEILHKAERLLEDDTALSDEKRASLKRTITRGIEAYLGRLKDRSAPVGPAVTEARRQQEERDRREADQISRMLADIKALRAAGRTVEAGRMQDELQRRFPSNPSVGAGTTIGRANDYFADRRDLLDKKAVGMIGTIREVEKSSIPEYRDYVLPADWAEKSKRRSQAMQLTEAERNILKALNTPITVDFDDKATFEGVIDYLSKELKIPNFMPPKFVLDAVQVTSETPVKLKADRVSFRTVLKRLLSEVGLTYIIKEGTIQVMTPAQARETMTTRTYYVGDLVQVLDFRFGPVANQFQMVANVNRILQMIVQSVDPTSWDINGGPGRISFDPITMSIVVRQTAEVHMMLGVGLR